MKKTLLITIALLSTPSFAADGKKVYDSGCFACHASGVLGAPKFGDKASWAEHLNEDINHIYDAAINGEGSMPAKGGNPNLSDEEVKAAVDYMLKAVK